MIYTTARKRIGTLVLPDKRAERKHAINFAAKGEVVKRRWSCDAKCQHFWTKSKRLCKQAVTTGRQFMLRRFKQTLIKDSLSVMSNTRKGSIVWTMIKESKTYHCTAVQNKIKKYLCSAVTKPKKTAFYSCTLKWKGNNTIKPYLMFNKMI